MTWIIIIIAAIVIIVAGYALAFSGKYFVSESLVINKPADDVFAAVADLTTQPSWSPWLMHEPDTKMTYSESPKPNEPGGFQSWDGKIVGAGTLTHVAMEPGKSISDKIEFLRPFKSVSEVGWTFEPVENGTKTTWWMRGKMPFMFRFMAKRAAMQISTDYRLGLAKLAGFIDPQAEHPRIEFSGPTEVAKQRCLVKSAVCKKSELPQTMHQIFPDLMKAAAPLSGKPMAVYHKVDMKADRYEMDIAAPTEEAQASGDYEIKELGGGTYMRTTLRGSYSFLEMVYMAAFSHVFMAKHKFDKDRGSLEIYDNDPTEQESSNTIQTSIYLPIK